MLKDKSAEDFVTKFLEYYLANGFGALQKREIDVLVFHLISSLEQIKDKSNYEIANFLKISESRVKSLRLEASLKHKPANHKVILGKIVSDLIDQLSRPDFIDGFLTLTLEDPVERRELEYAIKKIGYQVEYGINREVLKINPLSLLSIIIDNIENGEREFNKLVKSQIKNREKQSQVLDSALTLRQKINKAGDELSNKSGLLALIVEASRLMI